jgi:hypothetical protein
MYGMELLIDSPLLTQAKQKIVFGISNLVPQKFFLEKVTDLKKYSRMAYHGGPKVQKVMVQPINLIFR